MDNKISTFIKQFYELKSNVWAYLFFLLYVIVYNLLHLHQGYSPQMDEGYLLSLAQRMIDGDTLYVDFYYLRPPLTIYIQYLLIYIFGDAYTILAARIFLVIQISFLIILISRIYYKLVRPLELLFLLILSYTITSLLLTFPWYSYDGIFFTGIGIYLIIKEKYYYAGASLLLATMSKQNYILFLPLFLISIFVFQWHYKDKILLSFKSAIQICIGFIISGGLFFLLMIQTASFDGIINNLITYPILEGDIGLTFALFQNTYAAFEESVWIILITALLFLYSFKNKITFALLFIILLLVGFSNFSNLTQYIYFIIFFNYIVVLVLLRFIKNISNSDTYISFIIGWIGFVIVQYLSGFNYGGLFFAYMGAGVLLPFSYITIKKFHSNNNIRNLSVIIFTCFLILGYFHKYYYVYHDRPRNQIDSQFIAPKLKGIESANKTVYLADFLYETINKYSDKGDFILVYPDFPSIYYLTDRKNPSPVGWHYKLSGRMLTESLDAIVEKKPKLIFLHTLDVPKRISDILKKYYREEKTKNYFRLFIYNE